MTANATTNDDDMSFNPSEPIELRISHHVIMPCHAVSDQAKHVFQNGFFILQDESNPFERANNNNNKKEY
jgi:hypothetical protein